MFVLECLHRKPLTNCIHTESNGVLVYSLEYAHSKSQKFLVLWMIKANEPVLVFHFIDFLPLNFKSQWSTFWLLVKWIFEKFLVLLLLLKNYIASSRVAEIMRNTSSKLTNANVYQSPGAPISEYQKKDASPVPSLPTDSSSVLEEKGTDKKRRIICTRDSANQFPIKFRRHVRKMHPGGIEQPDSLWHWKQLRSRGQTRERGDPSAHQHRIVITRPGDSYPFLPDS